MSALRALAGRYFFGKHRGNRTVRFPRTLTYTLCLQTIKNWLRYVALLWPLVPSSRQYRQRAVGSDALLTLLTERDLMAWRV